MNSPNKERIKLLVDALRSDEFNQGEGSLAAADVPNGYKYCCLGVACEVAIKAGLKLKVVMDNGYGEKAYGVEESVVVLPREATDWYGFDSEDPTLKYNDDECTAIDLNDKKGEPFTIIADAFERTFLSDNDPE